MRIAVTGATGFVGRRLCARLLADGHVVVALTRDRERAARVLPARAEIADWEPERGGVTAAVLDGVDAVMHLAGAGVADGRWTEHRKTLILRSRVEGTRALVTALAALAPERRPRVLLSASAIGFYGDHGDTVVDEDAEAGTGFLAEVCQAWEREARAAEALGVRTVRVRIGIVLGAGGGALARMLPLFRLGIGGRLGSGRQWMSWIHLDDLVALWLFALEHDEIHGPLNAVAPRPVTNADFTRMLGAALGTPAIVPVPAVALRLALGEMADVLLGGQRVHPCVAERHGFRFPHPDLPAALTDLCRDQSTTLESEQWVPAPPSVVFPFFADARNLEELTPPFLGFRVLAVSTPTMAAGTRIDYRLSLHGIPMRWQSLVRDWEPERSFVDVQTRGPYRCWEHRHEFEPFRGGTVIRDRVVYELPLGALGGVLAGSWVARDLDAIFAFRRARVRARFG